MRAANGSRTPMAGVTWISHNRYRGMAMGTANSGTSRDCVSPMKMNETVMKPT